MLADPTFLTVDVFTEPHKLEETLDRLPDDILVEMGAVLLEDTWRTWLQQCCIASILLRRREGWMEGLARAWGISPKRVSEMASIWNRIVQPIASRGEAIPALPPSFYHEALRSDNPEEAIQMAANLKAQDGKFSVRQFRRVLKQGKGEEQARTSCKSCRFYQDLKGVPIEVIIEGTKYSLIGDIQACRHKGILGLKVETDLEFTAEGCEEFWAT
ncbi:MAG: hypothetical protein QXK45_03865 [Thermofilaceae archaeon]